MLGGALVGGLLLKLGPAAPVAVAAAILALVSVAAGRAARRDEATA
jgi:hypothetical protein